MIQSTKNKTTIFKSNARGKSIVIWADPRFILTPESLSFFKPIYQTRSQTGNSVCITVAVAHMCRNQTTRVVGVDVGIRQGGKNFTGHRLVRTAIRARVVIFLDSTRAALRVPWGKVYFFKSFLFTHLVGLSFWAP